MLCCIGAVARGVTDPDANDASPTETSSDATEQRTSSEPDEDTDTTEEIEETELEMPTVLDKNAAVAKDELERLGFTNIQFGSVDENNDTIGVVNPTNWTVVEQSHEPGEMVFSDAVIVLGCVKNT